MSAAPSERPDPYVFVSASEHDAPVVERLIYEMRRRGFTVLQAGPKISDEVSWSDAVSVSDAIYGSDAVGGAAAVVVVWSEASAGSLAVSVDAKRAQVLDTLIPVTVSGFQVVPPGFLNYHTLDLSGWDGDEKDPRFESLLQALTSRVRSSELFPTGVRLQLQPAANELLQFALTIAAESKVRTAAIQLDVVLAALVRQERSRYDRDALREGATSALVTALPHPAAERIAAALRVVGVDPSAFDDVAGVDVHAPLLDSILLDASAITERLGAKVAWSHHIVAAALARGTLDEQVLAALGVSQDHLRIALRRAIAERWAYESADVWDGILGPISARTDAEGAGVERVGAEHVDTKRVDAEPVDAEPIDVELPTSQVPTDVDPPSSQAPAAETSGGEDGDGDYDRELTAEWRSDYVDSGRRLRAGQQPPPELPDALNVDVQVTMIATLIARKTTGIPLSIGLFGEWGSGKSYFMELVRQKVEALVDGAAKDHDSPYHDQIVQLRFNAWHYSDANLWASLAAEFFDQLTESDTDPLETRRQAIREHRRAKDQLRAGLEATKKETESRTASLRAEWKEAVAQRELRTRTLDGSLLRSVLENTGIQRQLGALAKRLGLAVDDRDQALQIARDVRRIDDDFAATRRLLSRQSFVVPFALLLLTLVIFGLRLVVSGSSSHWLGGGAVAALTALIADLGAITGRARKLAGDLRDLAEQAQTLEARLIADDPNVSTLTAELERAEGDEEVARARFDKVLESIAELDRQLIDLEPGRRLYNFLAERAASTDYRDRLGVVSLLRRDFEQLVTLMDDWREHPTDASSGTPIDRIVLYIDDLDRCEPDQVVAVLQAVHLLLAMKLFVVVVGVDPRWLIKSLTKRYKSQLQEGDSASGDGYAGLPESTPQNYLEKIFQVPLLLPTMDKPGFARLVGNLGRPSTPAQAGAGAGSTSKNGMPSTSLAGNGFDENIEKKGHAEAGLLPPSDASRRPVPGIDAGPGPQPAEAGSEVAAAVSGHPAAKVTPITPEELAFLANLAPMVRTPRAATRLMNVYGLLRSTRNLTEQGQFLGPSGQPGDYQAVAQLLGVLTATPQLLGPLLWGRRGAREEQRGLCRNPRVASWREFVDALVPKSKNGRWSNSVADGLTSDEVGAWQTLTEHLVGMRDQVQLDDIESYQRWGPQIARFSFVLSPLATPADAGPVDAGPALAPPALAHDTTRERRRRRA